MGSNPNGITECYKGNIRKDVPFFYFYYQSVYSVTS
nr:MAG TPA: hypothetical protein [Caudoviricetes sp.]